MNKLAFLLFFLLVPSIISELWAQDSNDYVLIKQDGDITIEERWVDFPNANPPVKAREVKSEFYVNHSSIYAALDLLKDESKIKKWQSHVSKFRVYPQRDTTLWFEYSYHDIPWPVSDQDHFLMYQLSVLKPDEQLFVAFESRINLKVAPVTDDAARMGLAGSWQFDKLDKGRVKVTYRIMSMPSSIPKFFTDPVIRRNMMSTIKSYIALLENPKASE